MVTKTMSNATMIMLKKLSEDEWKATIHIDEGIKIGDKIKFTFESLSPTQEDAIEEVIHIARKRGAVVSSDIEVKRWKKERKVIKMW